MPHPADGMAKGISYGTLTATASMLLGMLLLASGRMPFEGIFIIPLLALLILLAAVILVTLAAMLIGVPVVWLLGRIDCACAEVCGAAGALAGAMLVLGPVLVSGGGYDAFVLVLALAAIAGGGMTGFAWGAEQERLYRELQAEQQAGHPNRIDDPRILR